MKSDLAKVVYPYTQALEERAPKSKDVDGGQELSELIRKERLPIAVLGKSYAENIARQFRAFNSIQLVSDHEQEHVAGSIASYPTRKTELGPARKRHSTMPKRVTDRTTRTRGDGSSEAN